MNGKHCLVYWVKTKQISVLLTKDIPVKKRQENVPIKLLWVDEATNKNTFWDAKILRFDDDAELLNSLIVDEDSGTVIDSEKATKKVGQKRRQLQRNGNEQKQQRAAHYESPQKLQNPRLHPIPFIGTSSGPEVAHVIGNNENVNEPPARQMEQPTERKIEQVSSTFSEQLKDQSCSQRSDLDESVDAEYSYKSDEVSLFPGLPPPTREVVEYFKAMVQHMEMMVVQQENKTRVQQSSAD